MSLIYNSSFQDLMYIIFLLDNIPLVMSVRMFDVR